MNRKWLTLLSFFMIVAGGFGCTSENINVIESIFLSKTPETLDLWN